MNSVGFLTATPEAAPSGADEVAEFITTDVQADSRLKESSISVEIKNNIAILKGETTSLDLAERAGRRAIASPDVRAVVNLISIKPASDTLVKQQIQTLLSSQKLIDASGIRVSENQGRVTLAGKVGTPDEQELARDLVSTVPGVLSIGNELEVTFEGIRTDERIKTQLARMIADDPLFDGLQITTTVKEGMVGLYGEVGSKGDLNRLIRHSYVTGVIDVEASGVSVNSDLAMEALGDKVFSSEQALVAIQDALALDPRVEAHRVRADFNKGNVTLTGTAAHHEGREAAESTVRSIPGVLQVSNQLKVQFGNDVARNELTP